MACVRYRYPTAAPTTVIAATQTAKRILATPTTAAAEILAIARAGHVALRKKIGQIVMEHRIQINAAATLMGV